MLTHDDAVALLFLAMGLIVLLGVAVAVIGASMIGGDE